MRSWKEAEQSPLLTTGSHGLKAMLTVGLCGRGGHKLEAQSRKHEAQAQIVPERFKDYKGF